MARPMRILFLGDVVGAPGRAAVTKHLPIMREKYSADVVIVNGENIRNGSGITPDLLQALRDAGADAVTLGDHVYRDPKLLRPWKIHPYPSVGQPICPIAPRASAGFVLRRRRVVRATCL